MHELPEQAAIAMPDEHKAFYLLGNNPAKMVTLLALYSLLPKGFVTSYRVCQYMAEMRQDTESWTPSRGGVERYCQDALLPIGALECEDAALATENTSSKRLRLAESGKTLGMIVAGALLPVELKTLEHEDEHDRRLSLQAAMGLTCQKEGELQGAPSRFAIFEKLLERPEGLSQADLRDEVGLPKLGTIAVLRQLVDLGLLHKEESYGGKRVFELSPDLVRVDPRTSRLPESKAVLEALVGFHAEGKRRITIKQVIDRGLTARPDLLRKRMVQIFRDWRNSPRNKGLMVPVKLGQDARASTRYTIADEYGGFIGELVGIKQKLVEVGPEAEDWRAEAWHYAADMTAKTPENAQRVALLMESVRSYSGRKIDPTIRSWKHNITELVPPEGISVADLHKRVIARGGHVQYNLFSDALEEIPGLGLIPRPELLEHAKAQRYVIKEHTFADNWGKDAACKGIDPEFFVPFAGHVRVHPRVQAQVEIARGICEQCPVRLPCLREALADKEQHAVRGGVWFRNRSELPRDLTRTIVRFVHIEEPEPASQSDRT